ncbi:vitellogenin receptor-like [Coccinella septempunctata]|uniref:vitellogenin receptor-like n=1 Tax=Coccinella septempunctata TaxID=41139 RepID=UPI001D066E8D|nr:vitellogenin receptor-like [Coccinella septempunctata]
MLPVKNVELTKVHYFEPAKHHRNVEISSISREVFQNTFNKNLIIKKNVFGHKWVLKINELDGDSLKKRKSVRCLLYCVVFSCILFAVLSGLFFTFELEKKFFDFPHIDVDQSLTNTAGNTDKTLKNLSYVENEDALENFKFSELNLREENGSLLDSVQISNVSEEIKNFLIQDSLSSSNAPEKLYCSNCTENHVCFKTEEIGKPKCVDIVDRHDPTGCGGLCILNVEYCAILDRLHKVYECSPLKNLLKCPSDTFNCGDQCIARSKVCDGIVHCKDMQDERFCDCKLEENFQCSNSTKCLPKNKRCDGIIDCWDRSDENDCRKLCPSGQYTCLDGKCIAQDNFCDGVIHCSDSSDEPQGCL